MYNIFLDFDGTLADSSEGIYKSFVSSCNELNLTPPNYQDFISYIGPPVKSIAKKIYPNIDDLSIDIFVTHFRSTYDYENYQYLSWYKNVKSDLKLLNNLNYLTLSIVTNKPTEPTLALLKSANIYQHFENVIGIDYLKFVNNGEVFKSKYEALNYLIKLTNADINKVFYVGDTANDQKCALKAGIRFIAAKYGFYKWDLNITNNLSIDDFESLMPLLNQLCGIV
tara:strand:+ start:1864 stop:2538 length:675 start_codon:yes stop_codon:yes gene_type:complete